MKRYCFILLFQISLIVLRAQSYDFVVSLDGTGNFTTIQAAIDASKAYPDSPVKIFIRNGIYREKISIPACNSKLQLIGENAENTVISNGDFFDKVNRGRNSTFHTYTLQIEADDFRMENITIENTAGPVGQAVAFHSEGDRSVLKNCRFKGNQDTMYLSGENSRIYLENCFVEGTTDFIFGGATAFFDNCEIHSKSNSYITAASTIKEKKYGFVFNNCKLTATQGVDKVFLGRPWRDYAKVVFLNCSFGNHIISEGWANWDKTNRNKTAFFAEYGNTGDGSSTRGRVQWSHQLTKIQEKKYTKDKVLAPAVTNKENFWEL